MRMRRESVEETLLVQYLLGKLPEAEQAQVEDRAFSDPGYLSALEGVEADLIDSYVRGELKGAERERFERMFLASPERRKKVEFARALARMASEANTAAPASAVRQPGWQLWMNWIGAWRPAMQFAAAMAFVVCAGSACWLVIQNGQMRANLSVLEARSHELEQREQSMQRQLAEERSRPTTPAPQAEKAPLMASLVLLPGLARAESTIPQLALTAAAQLAHIEIQLEPRDRFPRFRAELRTRAGDEVLMRSNLSGSGDGSTHSVSFDVPASVLVPGNYELTLKGVSGESSQDVGYYYFKVRRP